MGLFNTEKKMFYAKGMAMPQIFCPNRDIRQLFTLFIV